MLHIAPPMMQASSAEAPAPPRPAATQKRQRLDVAKRQQQASGVALSAAAASSSSSTAAAVTAGWVGDLSVAMEMFLAEHSLAFATELDRFLESGLTIQAYDDLCMEGEAEATAGDRSAASRDGVVEDQKYEWGSSADHRVGPSASGQSGRGEAEEALQVSSDDGDGDA